MIRNLKVLGLAILAIAALSAVSASGASAAEFHSESPTTTYIHGLQAEENIFTVNGRIVKCKSATFSGTASGSTNPELTIAPTYHECTAFGLAAEVKTNGCHYVFTLTGGSGGTYHGPVHIVCPAGASIEVLTSSCTVKVDPQTPEGQVHFTNQGSCTVKVDPQTPEGQVHFTNQGSGTTRDVLVTSYVNPVATVSGSILVCGSNGERPSTYRGTVTAKGYTNSGMGTQVGVWVE